MSTTRDTGTTSSLQGRFHLLAAIALSALLISACGSSSSSDVPTPPPADQLPDEEPVNTGGILNRDNAGGISDAEWPELNVRSDEPKQIRFHWTPVEGADHYRLYKNADGNSGYEQVGDNLIEPMAEDTIAVHQHHWHDARYQVEACMDAECNESVNSNEQVTTSVMLDSIGYFKASNTGEFDWFGWSLALSGDGQTLAVGAPREASMDSGVDANQEDNSVFGAGAVYVFTLSDGQWQQQAYLKASNIKGILTNEDGDSFVVPNERFGASLSISDDGNVLAVGAPGENSDGKGVNPSSRDNVRGFRTGAVYLFQRSDGDWTETDFLKASNATPAEEEEEGDQQDSEEPAEEPVTEETAEEEQEFQVPSNIGDRFGTQVVLSGDGRTLAVSAPNEASRATGINGDESDNSTPGVGAVYVFHQADGAWAQQAYVKPSILRIVSANNDRAPIQFGQSLALSSDGNTLAVGAPQEPSGGRGVDPSENPLATSGIGAVFTYTRDGSSWSSESFIKPLDTITNQRILSQGVGRLAFGTSVTLSADGNRLAVGLPQDHNASTGPEANPDDYDLQDGSTFSFNSGAVQMYERSNGQWSGSEFLKPSNTHASMRFGRRVAFSEDGDTLVVTALRDASAETGINGDGSDRSAPRAGAAFLFSVEGGEWREQSYIKPPRTQAFQSFGASIGLSNDAAALVVGAPREDGGDTGVNGDRSDNSKEDAGAVFMY